MNFSKKLLSVLLALVTLLSLLSVGAVVSAAPANETDDRVVVKVVAGEKASIPFYVNAYGCNGYFELDNRNLFSNLEVAETTGTIDMGTSKFSYHSTTKDLKGFTLSGVVNASAKVGDTCEIAVTYTRVDNMTATEYEKGLVKKIIVEVIKATTTTSATKNTTTTTKKPTTSTTKKPTTSTTKKPVVNLDLTELNRQIGIAETLIQTDYTYDSWAKLESALKAAKNARYADTQNEVNKAADALRQAIADLVKIDGTALRELLAQVREFLGEDDMASIWGDLLKAIEEAEAALVSGDQEAINSAYVTLKEAFEAFKEKIAALGEEQIVIQQVEVEGKCNEKCHVWVHMLWIILLIISAVLNVGFAVLVALYFIKRKKNAADNTPLVDYNINDD